MKKPDILMIVLDTQRVDRLSCYNPESNLTPNIKRFSEQAVVFDNAISAAQWTIPSHASMFTGLYPTAHQLTQSNLRLATDTPHVAEILAANGYETVGFCNNPLVGVLDNDLKRGFQNFYNYAGSFPNRPEFSKKSFLGRIGDVISGFMRRNVALPIQQMFGTSDWAFSISLSPIFTPLWSKWFSFKGQNKNAVLDVAEFVRQKDGATGTPFFAFLNLMETHLPFYPPIEYVERIHPELAKNRKARRVMQEWNREAYRWSRPLPDGLTELEDKVLNGWYDVETHYQDEFLQNLFDALAKRKNADNTLTIIVGDHGDGLGEHGFFGHAFNAYQELVHVPLIMHWPAAFGTQEQRVSGPVSSRRVFHTMLNAAGVDGADISTTSQAELKALSLAEVVAGRDVEQQTAYSEVYPPRNFVKAMEDRNPGLADKFRCNDMRRAINVDGQKLIQISDAPDELFDLQADQLELTSILLKNQDVTKNLNQKLNRMIGTLENQRDNLLAGVPLELEQDPQMLEHLRGLGYID
ncbi:MAG: arylsulfatase A-like enzyme [Cellvibrionaceae bacterium]|jgi:arylsulfatase A-like enzyme